MRSRALEFLDQSENKKRIRDIIGRGQRLNVKIDEVRTFDPKLSQYITKNPIEGISMFEKELNNIVKGMQEDHGKGHSEKSAVQSSDINFPKKVQTYYVNFEGNFGKNYVTPRGLKSTLVN